MTMACGMIRGTVVFVRCVVCQAVYGGAWRWDDVPETSQFPDGFHVARCVRMP